MSTRELIKLLLIVLGIPYAAFVFVSWQWNPATWPTDARFCFIITAFVFYAYTLITKLQK
jgi:hypothetical protein